MKDDFYSLLGVKSDSTKDQIKKAYRKLSKEHHPDHNQGNDEQFKKINEAYHTLMDDGKRAFYDRTGRIRKEEDLKKNAQGMLCSMFKKVVETAKWYRNASIDYVLEIGTGLASAQQQGKLKIAELKKDVEYLKKVMLRLQRKEEAEPFLEDTLIKMIQDKEFDVYVAEEAIEISNIAMKLLQDYSVKHDPVLYPTTLLDVGAKKVDTSKLFFAATS